MFLFFCVFIIFPSGVLFNVTVVIFVACTFVTCFNKNQSINQSNSLYLIPAINNVVLVAYMNPLLQWQENCGNCNRMATKMASMQSASQASERTIKNLKDVIALHDKPADGTLQQ